MLQNVYLLKPNEYSGNNSYMDSSRRRALDRVMSTTACQQLVCHLAELMLEKEFTAVEVRSGRRTYSQSLSLYKNKNK